MEKVFKKITHSLYQPVLKIRHFPDAQWMVQELTFASFFETIQKSYPRGISQIHHQFLCDFPRQKILVHGLPMTNISHFLSILTNLVDPMYHMLIVMMCTQACLGTTFEWIHQNMQSETCHVMDYSGKQGKQPLKSIAFDHKNDNLSQMKIHITIQNPHQIQFIIEKRFVQMNMDTLTVMKTIDTLTCFELGHDALQKPMMICASIF